MVAVLLGAATLAATGQAAAADTGTVLAVVIPGNVERPPPETAPGGVIVLRGGRPPNPEIPQATSEVPVAAPIRPEGWDFNYDATGFDQRFDRSGLIPTR
jgi:hypothetical protein